MATRGSMASFAQEFRCAQRTEPTDAQGVLRYVSGEQILVGDAVMEPTNPWDAETAPVSGWTPIFLHEAFGKVTEVMQPGSNRARSVGIPEGCIDIDWHQRSGLSCEGTILGPDTLFFVCRS